MKSVSRTMHHIQIGLLNAGALSLFLTNLSVAVRAQDTTPKTHSQVDVAVKRQASLVTVTFKTPQGQIHVFLTADMRPGDGLSGTVSLEPKGKNDTDRDSNRAQLSAYTLTMAGQSHPSQEPVLHWNLPADLKSDNFFLILTDLSQQEAVRTALPLQSPSENGTAPTKGSGTEKRNLPAKGQVGRPLVLNPSFLGGTEDLHIFVGDKEAPLLAASPRTYVVESPRNVLGKTKLQVKRGSELVAEGDFRNNRIGSGNPWPYVIGAAIITGIIISIKANDALHGLSNNSAHIF